MENDQTLSFVQTRHSPPQVGAFKTANMVFLLASNIKLFGTIVYPVSGSEGLIPIQLVCGTVKFT